MNNDIIDNLMNVSEMYLNNPEMNNKKTYKGIKSNGRNVIWRTHAHKNRLFFKNIKCDIFKNFAKSVGLATASVFEGGVQYPGVILNNNEDFVRFEPVLKEILVIMNKESKKSNKGVILD